MSDCDAGTTCPPRPAPCRSPVQGLPLSPRFPSLRFHPSTILTAHCLLGLSLVSCTSQYLVWSLILIASLVSLYGVSLHQGYQYVRHHMSDSWYIRSFVSVLFSVPHTVAYVPSRYYLSCTCHPSGFFDNTHSNTVV